MTEKRKEYQLPGCALCNQIQKLLSLGRGLGLGREMVSSILDTRISKHRIGWNWLPKISRF
jgi:hypothetical protein